MREIKFRAWNKIWGMMSLVDKIEFEEGKPVSVSVTIEATDFDHTDEWSDYEVGYDIILQQFTGLKDKNGKEIYDGDIVKWGHAREWSRENPIRIAEVKINPDIQFHSQVGVFKFGNFAYANSIDKDLEVIGNIFENPDLIN